MRIRTVLLGLAAGFTLSACNQFMSSDGPPPSGASAGPGARPLQQQSRDTAGGSPNASGGTATWSGTQGSRPTIDYSGPAAGNVGGTTPQTLPSTGRSRSP